MSANDRTGVGAGPGDWQTPPDLFARLNRRFAFDYDAFASHENALCATYSTTEGTFSNESWLKGLAERTPAQHHNIVVTPSGGTRYRASERDGLCVSWQDRRVFMNPPYSRGLIEKCMEKAFTERHNAALIVALIPAATETRWFQEFVLPHCHIDWLPKRVRYIDPRTGKAGESPPSGAVIAVFKTDLM